MLATGTKEQLQIPLFRNERIELVAEFRAAPIPGLSKTMRSNLANLCSALETAPRTDEGGLPLSSLAARLGTEVRTVQRWINAASDLGIVARVPRYAPDGSQLESQLQPAWDRLRSISRGHHFTPEADVAPPARGHAEADARPSLTQPDQVTPAGDACHTADVNPVYPSPPAECVRGGGDNCHPRGDKNPPITPISVFHENPYTTHHPSQVNQRAKLSGGGGDNCHRGGDKNPVPSARHCGPIPAMSRDGRAVVILEEADLRKPERLQEWFHMAVQRGWSAEIDRLWIFSAASSCWRRSTTRGGSVLSPVACFVRLIKRSHQARLRRDLDEWSTIRRAANQADEDWATRAMRYLDQRTE